MKAKTILEGCGAGIVMMLPYTSSQFSPDHFILYHSPPPNHAAWGVLLDLALVSVIATWLFAYLEKKATGARNLVWSLIAAKLATAVVYVLIASKVLHHLSSVIVFGAITAAGWMLYQFWPPAYQSSVKGLRWVLVLLGFSAFWMVPELLYLGIARRPAESVGTQRVAAPAAYVAGVDDSPQPGRRIVWLLFDELSYDQAFDHPYPGVVLPALNAFKRESVTFEATSPAGYFTERVVPSFFIGRIVTDLKSDMQGRALVTLAGQKGWTYLDGQRTLFADARQYGWTTGIAGWFNPYCRSLARSLDFCFWRPALGQLGDNVPYQSFWDGVLAPIRSISQSSSRLEIVLRQAHQADLAVLMERAKASIQDENIRFVFIHLPIPHPPGIYDRKTGKMRAGGTYIDNMVLADRTLGELMSTLTSTAAAGKTTVVLCSDHSWRVPTWQSSPGWTQEEETASGGKFETRPVLMIHFPGQTNEVPIPQPFDEIELHGILLQMLRGHLDSPAELTRWVQGNLPQQQSLSSAPPQNPSQEDASH